MSVWMLIASSATENIFDVPSKKNWIIDY